VELVATIPLVLVVTLIVAQLAVAGYALWSAADAARAGASTRTDTPSAS